LKRGVILIFIFFLTAGVAYSRGLEVKKKAGEYELEIKMDKNPPIVGDNHIEIEIKNAGKKITDAKVLINYYMPPMPRMAPMSYKIDAQLKKEKYRAMMNFIMAGPWYINIIINHAGKVTNTKINVDAQ
jgi:hypothetical protein